MAVALTKEFQKQKAPEFATKEFNDLIQTTQPSDRSQSESLADLAKATRLISQGNFEEAGGSLIQTKDLPYIQNSVGAKDLQTELAWLVYNRLADAAKNGEPEPREKAIQLRTAIGNALLKN